MRLAEFLVAKRDMIIAEWEAFARTCSPASGSMDLRSLADHASAMLTTIARDLDTPQSRSEQRDKSLGLAEMLEGPSTAAGDHGAARALSGFSMEQMVAEFRALRASVIRLWTREERELGADHLQDLVRFNEAIDQALAESVVRYTQDIDQSKEIFLAILGHDLRSPLGAIATSAAFMIETNDLPETHLALTKRIASSSKRMEQMIGDLLDFTRSRLGGGIPITRAPMSIEKAVHDVADEIIAANPGRRITIEARGGASIDGDCSRISQAIANLLSNAIEHSPPETDVAVMVEGTETAVTIKVHNEGSPLTSDQLDGIFGSMKAAQSPSHEAASGPLGHLGLGLYIAERIAHAHDGTISVASSEAAGTSFVISIPRTAHSGDRQRI